METINESAAISKEVSDNLGTVVATAGVVLSMQNDISFALFTGKCLDRYTSCDWGEVDSHDDSVNDDALENGGRILASYDIPEDVSVKNHDKIWIITEADRSSTTLLFPSEY